MYENKKKIFHEKYKITFIILWLLTKIYSWPTVFCDTSFCAPTIVHWTFRPHQKCMCTSDRSGTQNPGLGFASAMEIWVRQVVIFDDFSKWSILKTLWIFEKSSNMTKKLAKNEEKHCSTCLKPIFHLISGSTYPEIWFWVPSRSLMGTRTSTFVES